MIPVNVSKKLRDDGPNRLILVTSPRRRIMSLVLFSLLLTAMITGIDPSTDFSGKNMIGTVFFLCLITMTLLSASYSWKMICDKSSSSVIIRRDVLIFTVWQKAYPCSQINEIVFRKVNLLKGTDMAGEDYTFGFRSGSTSKSERQVQPDRRPLDAQGLLSVRSRRLTSLFIAFKDKELLLDSSTDAAALQTYGIRLAEFLNVPFNKKG